MNQTKKLDKYSWAKPTINFFSFKNRRSMWCESFLERDALLRLEFMDEVTAYRTQPISLLYFDGSGTKRRYTPDQLILANEETLFREVKSDSEAESPEFREKLSFIRAHSIARYRTPIEVIKESQIREGAYIDNLKKLYRYKVVSLRDVENTNFKREIGSECTLGDLRRLAERKHLTPVIPFALLAQGYFRCDLTLPLNNSSVLEVK